MSYLESEPYSSLVLNSVSDFDSDSESNTSSVLMNSLLCIDILLNKPADSFSFKFS